MKIKKIEIFQMPVRLKEPFVISLGAFSHANNVVVAIKTDNGLTGFGECSPFMSINGESMEVSDALITQRREIENRLKERYIERDAAAGGKTGNLIRVISGPRRAGKSFFAMQSKLQWQRRPANTFFAKSR